MAIRPSNHGKLDPAAAMLAAELANLSFKSTMALRGGSKPDEQRDAALQSRVERWNNKQRPDPAAMIAQEQALKNNNRDVLTSDGFKDVFASPLAPAPLPSGPFLPSLYQPNRKPVNHFAKPGNRALSPPRVRRGKKKASHMPTPPPSSSRRNQPPPPPVSGSRRQPRNAGARLADRRPLVHTTIERTPVKHDATPFGGLGKSRYASMHERVLNDLGKAPAKPVANVKPPVTAIKPAPTVAKPVAAAKPASGLKLSIFAKPEPAVVEEETITWTETVESDGTITRLI